MAKAQKANPLNNWRRKPEVVELHPPHLGGRGSVNDRRAQVGLEPIDEIEAEQGAPAVEIAPLPVEIEEAVPLTPKTKSPPKAKWSLRDTNCPTDDLNAQRAWNSDAKQVNFRTSPEMINWLTREVAERKVKGKEFADKQALLREALCLFFEQKAIIKDPG